MIHMILLLKIDRILPKWMTTWIAEYLNHRKQRVKISNAVSDWKKGEAGVTQGSVLGPVLFLLFIADLNNYLPESSNLVKFSDDLLTPGA